MTVVRVVFRCPGRHISRIGLKVPAHPDTPEQRHGWVNGWVNLVYLSGGTFTCDVCGDECVNPEIDPGPERPRRAQRRSGEGFLAFRGRGRTMRFVRQIPLGHHEGARDVFMAVEAWHIDQQRTVRLTVSHPDPDRHIGVVMGAEETWHLICVLLQAFPIAFLRPGFDDLPAGARSDVTEGGSSTSGEGGER